MPEIGLRAALIFSVAAFIGGILIGTHTPLIWQTLIVAALLFFISSSAVRSLELGALCYIIITVAFCAGMAFGDISYFFQKHTDMHFSSPFKVP